MTNPIVKIQINQIQAPAPNQLQKTGALITQGGTTLPIETYSLLTQLSDLTPLLAASLALTSLTWASAYGGQATATATVAHGVAINEQFVTTIAGALPAGYNGTFLATATGASTFTYYLPVNPGTSTVSGNYSPRGVGDLVAAATSFFAQGATQAVYVLELGAGAPTAGVTALTEFINNTAQKFYSYLVPRNWDANASFLAYLAQFQSTTAKTYFFITSNLQNYLLYTSGLFKDALVMVEAPVYRQWAQNSVTAAVWSAQIATVTLTTPSGVSPGDTFTMQGIVSTTIPGGFNGTFIALPGTTGTSLVYAVPGTTPGTYTSGGVLQLRRYASAGVPPLEYSIAGPFQNTLNWTPSTVNRVPPLDFVVLDNATPFPTPGNAALIQTLDAANINYVGTGSEGGISNTILLEGHLMDGRPFNYWYSVDWLGINGKQNVANAVINGSQSKINPLYYNQDGINRLQQALANTCATGIAAGLILGRVIPTRFNGPDFNANLDAGVYAGNCAVNAIPFTNYTKDNPSDYRFGVYNGLSVVMTPSRGFESILINIEVTDFV